MEKRISYSQFKIVKDVARAIDPIFRQKANIQQKITNIEEDFLKKEEEEIIKLKQRIADSKTKKLEALNMELQAKDGQIEAIEAGVVKIVGFHVTDLVKKVIEPTGKTDDKGNPVKVTKYLPTDMVSYDEQKKEYVITLPDTDNQPSEPVEPEANDSTPTEEPAAEEATVPSSSDEVEQPNDANNLPWDNI